MGWGVFYYKIFLFADAPLPFPTKPPPKLAELAPIEISDFAYRKLIVLSPSIRFSEIIEERKGVRCCQIINFDDFERLPPTSVDGENWQI